MENTHKTSQFMEESIQRNSFLKNLKIYLGNPLYTGMMSFAALFSLILLADLFGYLIGTNETVSIGIQQVIFSLIGFVLGAGVKFLEFFGKEN